ncbi:MAG: 6-carboxytetrahydropterin synthase [Chloroflexi bacterium]|nr:6-carboxytetrahydropterin synthase [Chloroflexota bacterium]
MIIQKQYRFYAAHRNQELQDKCSNLHGHRYGITCFFEVERTGSLTTLFADFDGKIEPFLKAEYDHGMLVDIDDPLYETLVGHMERTGETLKLKRFSRPTTVENLAHQMFTEITEMGFRLRCFIVPPMPTGPCCETRRRPPRSPTLLQACFVPTSISSSRRT